MLATTHAIAGVALATLAPTPEAGFMFAFLSHPILDFIPHWDLKTRHTKRSKSKIIFYSLLDAFIGFLLAFLIFSNSLPLPQLLLTIFIAQTLDWFEAPYTIFGWKFPPFSWIKQFQHRIHTKLSYPDGLFTQIIIIFFLLLISK